MKFKRFLAAMLSVLTVVSMATFTASAADDDAETTTAAPVIERNAAGNSSGLFNCERGIATSVYDEENNIVYVHVVPRFEATTGNDNSIYVNMYNIGTYIPQARTVYAVAYFRSNVADANTNAGFYQVKKEDGTGGPQPTSAAVKSVGNDEWQKAIYTIELADEFYSTVHFWLRPIGANTVNKVEDGVVSKVLPEDTYYDIAGVALFEDKEAAEKYDIAAVSSGKVTISFDPNNGTDEVTTQEVVSSKYKKSNITFPETEPQAPQGKQFAGWSESPTGSPVKGDVAAPEKDTTYYAIYEYVDDPNVDYDEIALQNTYTKLSKGELTIGYLGGSVTCGSGTDKPEEESWRALTTKWFKDNFANAEIKEVFAGIGGTGSRFASYRATRDLKLDSETIDLLFIDTCINDRYEGITDSVEIYENYRVIVEKVLQNNPKCNIVIVNVPDSSTAQSADDSAQVAAVKTFANENGITFIDFKLAIAQELMEDKEAVSVSKKVVDEKWSDYLSDIVHPNANGYKVYADYLVDNLLNTLTNSELNISKAKYEDTKVAYDRESVDTDRFCGGTQNSLDGLTTIKNYGLGQKNGFIGGNSAKAAKAGYSTTFKFTGSNAYIWGNQYSHNGVYEVYNEDYELINSIDMWRNQESTQSYMFPVFAEDKEVAEYTVTIVLAENEERPEGSANTGTRLENVFRNLSVKGGTMDSVEFLEAPSEFQKEVEYSDIEVSPSQLSLRIDGAKALDLQETEFEGKKVLKMSRASEQTGNWAVDGWNIGGRGVVLDYYNYVTIYMYVDDPELKTKDCTPFFNIYQTSKGGTTLSTDTKLTPNAWQRISLSLKNAQDKAATLEALKQYHFRPLGGKATVEAFDGVTLYVEKLVFSAEDPGNWVDLSAKVTEIAVDGTPIEDFTKNTFEYNVELPYGTTEIPTVTAKTNVDGATVEITQADSVNGTATVVLKGETEEDDITYTIKFDVFDGVRLKGFKVVYNRLGEFTEDTYEIVDGIYEYSVDVPADIAVKVDSVKPIYEGNPELIDVNYIKDKDEDRIGEARISIYNYLTTYFIEFSRLRNIEEDYLDADNIFYVSNSGSGAKDGSNSENSADWGRTKLSDVLKADKTTVLVVGGQIPMKGDIAIPSGATAIFTSASSNGSILLEGSLNFKSSKLTSIDITGKVVLDNVKIFTENKTEGGERIINMYGNDLEITENFKNDSSTFPGKGPLNIHVGCDATDKITNPNGEINIEINGGERLVVRAGGFGGTVIDSDINYTVGGKAQINELNLGAHDANSKLTDEQKTVKGDITLTVDGGNVNKVTCGGIVDGDIKMNINKGTIGSVFSKSANQKGNVDLIYNKNKYNSDTFYVTIPDNINLTHIVSYEGVGSVDIDYDKSLNNCKLMLQTERSFVLINEKAYEFGIDSLVPLEDAPKTYSVSFDEIGSTTANVRFTDGTPAHFKVDNVIIESQYGYPEKDSINSPSVTIPAKSGVVFDYWYLESDENKTPVTDFGKFVDDKNGVTFVAQFRNIKSEEAEYTFKGKYDYSEQKYTIDMYYVGSVANMTAFGIKYPEECKINVTYEEWLQSTGTHFNGKPGYEAQAGRYADIIYPASGGKFGNEYRSPVKIATIQLTMTPEQFFMFNPKLDFGTYQIDEEITGAFKNGLWQHIINSEPNSLDVAKDVYPVYFNTLEEENIFKVDYVDLDKSIISGDDLPYIADARKDLTFYIITDSTNVTVSYYVDDVAIGECELVNTSGNGKEYKIPAEKVAGNITIEFTYGEAIQKVEITDITAPAAQATPDTTANVPTGANYTVEKVEWTPNDQPFGFDTAYTVKATVKANDGYAITAKTEFTINGQKATATKIDSNKFEVSYTFANTVKELGNVSITVNLVRSATDKPYNSNNFGQIIIKNANNAVVVAQLTETADDEPSDKITHTQELLAGKYDIIIAKNGYIKYQGSVDVKYNDTTVVTVDLIPGDVSVTDDEADKEIDLLDFAAIVKAFTSETEITDVDALNAYRADVDIDEDGIVTIEDLLYVKLNMGKNEKSYSE